MDIQFFDGWHQPIGVFTFVLAIILIGSVTSWLKTRSQQETIREAIKAGIKIEPDMLNKLNQPSGSNSGGMALAGCILLASGIALVFFGYQLGQVDGDDEVFTVFIGIAGFPFLIGIALLIGSLFRRGEKPQD